MGSKVQELSTIYTSPGRDVTSDCNYADQARYKNRTNTGGEGAFTQWVWVELIEGTETICPANTHQVHAEFI